MLYNESWQVQKARDIENKPKAKPHDRVFRNTFSAPHFKNKWVSAADIFLGLKFGVFKWEKLPKEVQDAVEDYIEDRFNVNLDEDYPLKEPGDPVDARDSEAPGHDRSYSKKGAPAEGPNIP